MTTGKNKSGRPPKASAEKRTAEVKFHVTPDVKRRLQNRQGNNLNQLARIANTQKGMEGIVIRLIGLIEFYERLAAEIRSYFKR